MLSSSNMFLKKLITNNLCFPARSTTNCTTSNEPPSCHFSTHYDHHDPQSTEDPPLPDSSTNQNDNEMLGKTMKIIENSRNNNKYNTLDLYPSTTPDDDDDGDGDGDGDVYFTSSSNSDDLTPHHQQQPDVATLVASQRFFFSSPGHSKSIIRQQHSSTPPEEDGDRRSGPLLVSTGGVPVPKYSPDPYWDFRRSMQEMVEARAMTSSRQVDPAENWKYLHQLLTCYLSLNPINTHECIIQAFSDLLVNFLLHNGDQ